LLVDLEILWGRPKLGFDRRDGAREIGERHGWALPVDHRSAIG
jgi:hypothetical protein